MVEIGILFLPESTEGVDPGQVTALDYENEANRTEKWEKRDEHWADCTKIEADFTGLGYVCLRWSALRIGQGNVANVSITDAAFDGFAQEVRS